ncbi:MAG: LysR family transcriptional regulator, partial [Rhizobacter sp.]|nr:LysR family transcriptional regulator [Rhizobacter sp.]
LARTLAGRDEAATGTVRITTSRVAASYLLPPVLAALGAAEPGIQVELVVSDEINNLLRREADIAVRLVRPAQDSLVAKKLADLPITACAHQHYLQRAGTPLQPADLMRHRLIGFDRDESLIRGFAQFGVPFTREHFALRTDDLLAYGRMVACGAGIGFLTRYTLAYLPGVVPVLPKLEIPPLPCWLAVHREVHGNRLVRRVFDFLAEALPKALADGMP